MRYLQLVLLASILVLFILQRLHSQPAEPYQPDENTVALWHMDAAEPESLWIQTFDEDDEISISSLIRTEDGDILACGSHDDDVALANVSEEGEINWSNTFNFGMRDRGTNLIQCSNGNIAIACISFDPDNINRRDWWILITDTEGDSITAYTHDELDFNLLSAIAETENVGIILGGETRDFKLRVVKFDSEGNLTWIYEYEDVIGAFCSGIIPFENEYYICGGYFGEENRGIVLTINDEGEEIWTQQYGNNARINSMLLDEDVFICAGSESDNYWVFAIDREGDQLWSINTGSEHIDNCREIIRAFDNNYLIVGTYDYYWEGINQIGGDIGMMKVSPEGDIIWQKNFGGENTEEAYDAVVLDDGSYFISGFCDDDENFMPILFRTTPDLDLTTDVSGNGNHAEIGLSAGIDDGLWGDALDTRSEEGGYLLVQNDESLHLASFSIEAWFEMLPDLDQTGTIIKKALDVESSSYMLWISSEEDRVGFVLTTEERTYELMYETQPDDEDWHHIAGTFENQVARLYYDHEIRSEQQIEGDIFYDDCELLIGTGISGGLDETQFYGLMDEVRISDIDRGFHSIDGSHRNSNIPLSFEFHPPFPNPFNTATFVKFGLPSPGFASLSILDIRGSVVSLIKSNYFPAGEYVERINMLSFPTGIYFIRLEYGNETLIRTVTYLK